LHALENDLFLYALKVVLNGGLINSASCALLDAAIQAWTKLSCQRLKANSALPSPEASTTSPT
jgi:hypothetical protein